MANTRATCSRTRGSTRPSRRYASRLWSMRRATRKSSRRRRVCARRSESGFRSCLRRRSPMDICKPRTRSQIVRSGRRAGTRRIAAITKGTSRDTSSNPRSITTRSPAARTCGSTTPRRNSPIAGWRTSAPGKRCGSMGTRRWSRRWCASAASSTTWKERAKAMRTSRWRASCSSRAAAAPNTTRATCRRSNSTRPWATRCARCISTQAWRTSRRRRTTATTKARCVRSPTTS